jgi:hypothetical protein
MQRSPDRILITHVEALREGAQLATKQLWSLEEGG